jgi:hypothetical protein
VIRLLRRSPTPQSAPAQARKNQAFATLIAASRSDEMAGSAARPVWLEIKNFVPSTPVELEQLKRDRLRELRATIEALRDEQQARDPLLAWVMEQETGIP